MEAIISFFIMSATSIICITIAYKVGLRRGSAITYEIMSNAEDQGTLEYVTTTQLAEEICERNDATLIISGKTGLIEGDDVDIAEFRFFNLFHADDLGLYVLKKTLHGISERTGADFFDDDD